MDYRDQDGSNDWYDGGCMVVSSADQYMDEYLAGEPFDMYNDCNGDWLTMDPEEDCGGLWISNHPDWWYNGFYYQDGLWNGYPHYTDGMGAHLYWLESGSGGWWQFDNREQDGTNDWYDGGYMWCDGWDQCSDYDDNGHATYYFNGAGDIDFDLDFTDCWEDDCIAFQIDHPDWWYTGYYYQDEDWNGYPHFTDGMGAHLYWFESGSGGWWQFDNREQDGTNDWYEGGYFWCDAYDACGGDEDWEAYGSVTHHFNGDNGGDVTFSEADCSAGMVGNEKTSSYSTTTIVSGAVLAAASIGAVRYIAKSGITASQKNALYA